MKIVKILLETQPKNLNLALLIFRVLVGGLMLLHGFGKLQDLINGKTSFFDDFDSIGIGGFTMLLVAVVAEFGCSLLIILGLFTRFALVPLILTMAIAFFMFHANDGLMDKETPLLYLICFVILFFTGSGKYFLDHLLFTRLINRNSRRDA